MNNSINKNKLLMMFENYDDKKEFEIRININDYYFYKYLLNNPNLEFDKKNKNRIEYFGNNKDDRYYKVNNSYYKKTKSDLQKYFYEGAKITLSNENIEQINEPEMIKNNQIRKFRYKSRVKKQNKLFPGWIFDFTKSIITENKNQLDKLLNTNKFNYQLEIELIKDINNIKKDKKVILSDIISILKWFNDQKLSYKIQDKLNIKNKSYTMMNIVNNPIDLNLTNFANIQNNYSVSEKADGERKLLLINNDNIYSIEKPFNFEKVKLNSNIFNKNKSKNNSDKLTLIDTEYVNNIYYMFDILIDKNINVTNLLLRERLARLNNYKNELFKIKNFYFTNAKANTNTNINANTNNKTIFDLSKDIYNKNHPYNIDGLIFTPTNESYEKSIIYKWKPIEDLTIDFLIKKIKKDYYYLFVSITKNQFLKLNVKLDTEYMKYFPTVNLNKDEKIYYYFLQSPIAKLTNKELEDGMIVELNYDNSIKSEEEKWKLYRIRHDKTRNFKEGGQGPNSMRTANAIFNNILNPISKKVMFGNEKIKYYKDINTRKNGKDELNIYKYNNFIKSYLYDKYLKKNDKIIELAGGRGGDLFKLNKKNISEVLLLNINQNALNEAKKRSKNLKSDLKIDFLEVDLSKNNSINKLDKLKPLKNYQNKYDIISCQFALHYFLKDEHTSNLIKKIIDKYLKNGGYFIFTGYDGKILFDKLKNSEILKYEANGNIFAEIEKLYNENSLLNYGQQISVYVEKIGIKHNEYLINFEYIKKLYSNYEIAEEKNFSFNLDQFKRYLNESEKEYIKLHKFLVLKKVK